MNITEMTALQIGKAIKNGDITSVDAVKAYLDRIEKLDKQLNCFVTVCADQALKAAAQADEKIKSGELTGALAGVPIGIKDNISTKDIRTTCSSRMLENYVPAYDATVIERIKAEGMIIIGKLNMDEFAMGSTTETSYMGVTRNPWDTERVPGGSSGGSAAAVAARLVPIALGSDTGGSIRQPSSFCGVTGIKPTYGSVSRYGLVAFASSLDQIGPIAQDAADCAALLSVISGRDYHDSTCDDRDGFNFADVIDAKDVKGMKIGVPNDFFGEGLDGEVKQKIEGAIEQFRQLGAEVEYFDMPETKYSVPTYYIICCAEASSNLSRYDGVKYGFRGEGYEGLTDLYIKSRSQGFGMEVKRRSMLGAFVLSSGYYDAYYNKALKVKALLCEAYNKAFQKYDIILGPTAPTPAYKIGENTGDPLKVYLMDIYTAPVNLAGLPGINICCGTSADNLPIGVQLVAKPFGESKLMQAAAAYQSNTEYHKLVPAGIEE